MGRQRGSSSGFKKPPLTHFLCVPLVTETSRPQLERSVKAFRDSVTLNDSSQLASIKNVPLPLVHPKAVRPVGALHLTLGVCSLDRNQLAEAVALLESLDASTLLAGVENQISEGNASNSSHLPSPLVIDMKGLESMHSPQKASVLYCSPLDSSDRLYPFCLALQTLFREKGFLVEDQRTLKLHATVVNTIYAKGKQRRSRVAEPHTPTKGPSSIIKVEAEGEKSSYLATNDHPGGQQSPAMPQSLDARGLLKHFKQHVWAERVVLDRVAICEMGAKRCTDGQGNVLDERYTEIASMLLPT